MEKRTDLIFSIATLLLIGTLVGFYIWDSLERKKREEKHLELLENTNDLREMELNIRESQLKGNKADEPETQP
jgi:hypothetical protein